MNSQNTQQKTQQFLDAMEQSRKAKACSTVIDLRKRVPGECRDYTLGGVRHCLDDRGYVLLKNLIDANNDQYTVGIYEDFMAIFNQFKEQDKAVVATSFATALMKRSKEEGPELIPFDRYIQRNEERVKLAVKLEVRAGAMGYSGATVDISPHAMKIVLQRAFQLESMMPVIIDFTELYSQYKKAFLQQVPYQILHIAHTHNLTHIVVERSDDSSPDFGAWFVRWFEQAKQGNPRNANLDGEIYNQLRSQYIKLYCGYLNRPVFFLKQTTMDSVFLTPVATKQLSFVNAAGENKTLWINDFAHFLKKDKRYNMALLCTWLDGELYAFSNYDVVKRPLEGILAWLQTKPQWRVFLVSSREIHFPESEEINAIRRQADDKIATFVEALNKRYHGLTACCYLQDITSVFANIEWRNIEPVDCRDTCSVIAPVCHDYSDTAYSCIRREPRVLVNAQVKVNNAGNVLNGELISFSLLGLKVALDCETLLIKHGDIISIEFTEWNEHSDSIVEPVQYTVVNVNREQQRFVLRLLRDTLGSSRQVDAWMDNRFKQLENTAAPCLLNYEQNYYFTLFSSLVAKNISGLPFFIGRDDQGVRIIQAIGVTAQNNSMRDFFRNNRGSYEWDMLQLLALDLGKAISEAKPGVQEKNAQLALGIYCYLDTSGNWLARTDLHFATPQDKQRFIIKALAGQKYYFYHCALTALKTQNDPQIRTIVESVASKSLKKAKEVSALFNSLIAVGELTNTTKLVAHIYTKLAQKRNRG